MDVELANNIHPKLHTTLSGNTNYTGITTSKKLFTGTGLLLVILIDKSHCSYVKSDVDDINTLVDESFLPIKLNVISLCVDLSTEYYVEFIVVKVVIINEVVTPKL